MTRNNRKNTKTKKNKNNLTKQTSKRRIQKEEETNLSISSPDNTTTSPQQSRQCEDRPQVGVYHAEHKTSVGDSRQKEGEFAAWEETSKLPLFALAGKCKNTCNNLNYIHGILINVTSFE